MTTYNKSKALSSHDIATVTIAGCFNNFLDGSQPNLTLRRGTPFPNKEDVERPTERFEILKISPVALRPTVNDLDRPSGDKLHAHLLLGETPIAQGEFGIILEANIDFSSSSPELARMKFPPLVAKVCRPRKYYKIPREAFYYEYLESLQGSVIPRYYGLFQVTIPEGVAFKYWPVEKSRIDSFELETYCEDSDDEDHIAYPRLLTLLLLELLGDPPSHRTTMDALESLKSQAFDMFSELSHFRIKHGNIHAHNIVMAAPRLPDFPNLPSPRHQRTYDWRLIDFSLARKTDIPEYVMLIEARECLDSWLDDVEMDIRIASTKE
ncbi:unnamed protein product [Somion occarium]|uniref:Protein kinase domain-containing protein n=1 Tax=Somion occarium TaxID=3059160 RepID=A0ABP1E2R1_9APHY